MQATAYTYDPDSRSGQVLLDDGTPVPFDAAAFDAGGLRLLRPAAGAAGDGGRGHVPADHAGDAADVLTRAGGPGHTAGRTPRESDPTREYRLPEGGRGVHYFLRAVVFLAVVLRAVDFLAGAFLAVAFFAGAFFAVVFFAAVLLAAAVDFAGAFFAVVLLAVVLAVAFLAVVFFAAAFLAVAAFFAVVFLAAAFFTVAEAPPVRLPLGAFFTATSPPRGSFFEPLTRSLKP